MNQTAVKAILILFNIGYLLHENVLQLQLTITMYAFGNNLAA